eukprot:CAMPEP_0184738770 /NCGR_PEP_ID=MMETSP0315-20130426/1479_1 /TAXON_ID=101924 /ORGANISM="Rhodosorus marinus, Strain UTEX LB 2760" /LENGTH=35 /DNA_ID= /DNA_START= /DNA_END= /DNA_ORIENTATION=
MEMTTLEMEDGAVTALDEAECTQSSSISSKEATVG